MTSPEPADPRRTRRLWLTLAGIFAVLLSLLVYLYAFHDIPPPDPALYQVEFKPIPPGENALEVFEKETQALRQAATEDWTKRCEEDPRLVTYEPGCEEALKAHIETHDILLEKFWTLINKAQRPLGYPGIKSDMDVLLNIGSSTALFECYKLGRADIALNAHTGTPTQAIADSLRLVAFAKELSQTDGVMIQWLMTITCQMKALTALSRSLAFIEPSLEDARAWLSQLQQTEIEPQDLSKNFRLEELAQGNFWRRWKLGNLPTSIPPLANSWFERITLKPNMSMKESLDRILPLSAGIQNGWTSAWKAREEFETKTLELYPDHTLKYQIHPNRTGRKMIAESFSTVALIVTKTIQTVIHNRCLQTALALRTYELEKGSLPATLEELVSHILPSLPEDPITGTALKWNPQTGRIYSVGENEKDDGGDFEPSKAMKSQKDWGILYPWHPVKPVAP